MASQESALVTQGPHCGSPQSQRVLPKGDEDPPRGQDGPRRVEKGHLGDLPRPFLKRFPDLLQTFPRVLPRFQRGLCGFSENHEKLKLIYNHQPQDE